MTIAYLGPSGTYSELAAQQLNRGSTMPMPTIPAVFQAVADGKAALGVVPLENLIHGPVTETLDTFYRFADAIRIVDMRMVDVVHALGCLKPNTAIHRIFSKDVALEQCGHYLGAHYPAALRVSASSTAQAVSLIAEQKLTDAAAIARAETLREAGFSILAENIGDVAHNRTRFAVIARDDAHSMPTGRDSTLLVIHPHSDRVGLLRDILHIISDRHGINLCNIHSRPDTQGGVRFYIEIEGHRDDHALSVCLTDIEALLHGTGIRVAIFGSYPRISFAPSHIQTIGIIGGTGRMGQWLKSLFEKEGCRVLIAGRKTELTPEQCAERSDAVLINVPITETRNTIARIAPHMRKGTLLVDNTSIKTDPVRAMLEHVPQGVEVLGMHTVFGPSTPDLKDQNVVFVRTDRSGALADLWIAMFYKHGAHITLASSEEHDKQMAFHQNLEHFTKAITAYILHTQFNGEEMEAFASPNSRETLRILHRMLSQDPELFGQIQEFNEQGPAMITAFVQMAEKVAKSIAKGDSKAFTACLKT